MAAKTISSSTSTEINLGNYTPAELTVTNTGAVIVAGTAVTAGVLGTVVNYGNISGTGHGSTGMVLSAGGTITNHSGATIYGYDTAITISGAAGTLVNDGNVTAKVDNGVDLGDGGSISNDGVIYGDIYGVDLASGGTVTNLTGAQISGNVYGIYAGTAATVVNAGNVSAHGGITLKAGGTVTNQHHGAIQGLSLAGIYADGSATVFNANYIKGSSYGVVFTAGGYVYNQPGGTIKGSVGISISGAAGSVANDGSVDGYDGFGIALTGGGTVVNSDSVEGSSSAIYLKSGGAITNKSDGYVTGENANGILVRTIAATVVNYGYVYGAVVGIGLNAGGYVNNHGGGTVVTEFSAGVQIGGEAGTVVNAGTVSGGRYGVRFDGVAGTMTNAGSLRGSGYSVGFSSGYTNRLVIDPGAVFGGVVLGGGSGSTIELASSTSAGTLSDLGTQYLDFGRVIVDANAKWTLTGANTLGSAVSLTNHGTFTLSGATLADSGTVTNDGIIALDPSTLSVAALVGTGAVTLGASGTLEAQGTVAAGETVAFNGNNGVLQLADPTGFAGEILFFAGHETIALPGIVHNTADTAIVSNTNTLVVKTINGGTFDLLLNPAVNLTGTSFTMGSRDGGSEISAIPCYVAGTRIRTVAGEVPVEALRIDDLLITRGGAARPVRWIGRRGYAAGFVAANRAVQPVCVRAGALGAGLPRRDLYVSPQHALHFEDGTPEGMLVPSAALVNGVSILRCPDYGLVRFFHVELDEHDCIFAEGVPAESFVDRDCRGMFENAREYTMLFGNDPTPAARFCAPRVEEGFILEALHRRLSGLPHRPVTPGPLRGHVERINGGLVEGWAMDLANPLVPVELELIGETGTIARLLANRYRADLDRAGLAGGRCAFTVPLPEGVTRIEVRRAADGPLLPRAAAA